VSAHRGETGLQFTEQFTGHSSTSLLTRKDVVTSDALISRYGVAILRKSGPTKGKLIAQRMRQIARLKMEVNKDPTLASLSVLDDRSSCT